MTEATHTLQGTGSQEIVDVSFSYGKKTNMNIAEQIKNNTDRITNSEANIKYLENIIKSIDKNN